VNSELIINSTSTEVVIALLQDKRLSELTHESKGNDFSVGDIFLGKVRKIDPAHNAAFVNIGHEKDAFLHYHDLGPQIRSLNKFTQDFISGQQRHSSLRYFQLLPDTHKHGKISEVLTSGQAIMVQIVKEPISTKGPRITAEVCLAGRYLVLIPFSERVSISQKIKSKEERDRLLALIESIRPKNFGVIIRTVASDKPVAELDADLKELTQRWKDCCDRIKPAEIPTKLLGELSRTNVVLRDMLNASFNKIHVNDSLLYEEIKNYIKIISPDKEKIVELYKKQTPIFEHFGVENQIKGLFGKNVTLKSGAYLIIEHTEAMHVIDVNSGGRSKSGADQESNALQVNVEAAKEVARQLRLRDMGGIIVIDFIDMRLPSNRKQLFDTLRDEMKQDRAKHKILPPSRFGIIQITRERVRPVTHINVVEKCPACQGTGEARPSILLIGDIENRIQYLIKEQNEKILTLQVHPYVEAYITRGLLSLQKKWALKYKRWIKVTADSHYHFLEYSFLNGKNQEIKTT
jgi:ribonuclease G